MTKIDSSIDIRSAEFAENTAAMSALVEELRRNAASVSRGGDEKSRERHLSRGKLLPRDRVDTLLDPGSPFLE
ncbi:MAG: methylcrotonoyl-CoA carboxylase, partial [Proteobacteria bacterium]|nr:methylcrotonoyl-CoA carboxylase [Pseudomonadota bacterium]